MKYIKLFESNNYNKGDYIIVDIDKVRIRQHEYYINNQSPFEFNHDFYTNEKRYAQVYLPKFPHGMREGELRVLFYDDSVCDIFEDDVERLMTPEEIEYFEAKKDAIKYNL